MKKNSTLLTKEEIIEKIKTEKEFLKQNYHLTEIGLFGSYVRGEQKKKSDIDILIDYDRNEKFSLFDLVDLGDYMSELLGVKVDVALKRSLKTVIGYYILKEVIYI
ncbi:MAG: nucleotidyltransferase [Ignavibacteria bacterium]|nr:nucleotidyltransferase [Ignavibacteria bacterium]